MLWNENIDWKLIAPYVTGDSIGGFLKGETYYFNGGYASESGSWTWGITGGYRASHNYRHKDPRPRNTASDLSFALGAGYRLGTYRLGVSADFRLYQQKSEISFLADKGSTSVYHMLGLGMDYVPVSYTHLMRMQNMRLSLLNDTTFEVVVDNEIIAKDFTALIPNIQAYRCV